MVELYASLVFVTALDVGLSWFYLSNHRLKKKNNEVDRKYDELEAERIWRAKEKWCVKADEQIAQGSTIFLLTPEEFQEFSALYGPQHPSSLFCGLPISIWPVTEDGRTQIIENGQRRIIHLGSDNA